MITNEAAGLRAHRNGRSASANTSPETARLIALPRQPALEQEQQRVREGLEVVTPAGGAAQVSVHAGVPHGSPEHVRPLVILHMGAADRVPPSSCCGRVQSSVSAIVSQREQQLGGKLCGTAGWKVICFCGSILMTSTFARGSSKAGIGVAGRPQG